MSIQNKCDVILCKKRKTPENIFYLRYIVILILLFRCIVKFAWREQYRSFNCVLLFTQKNDNQRFIKNKCTLLSAINNRDR